MKIYNFYFNLKNQYPNYVRIFTEAQFVFKNIDRKQKAADSR